MPGTPCQTFPLFAEAEEDHRGHGDAEGRGVIGEEAEDDQEPEEVGAQKDAQGLSKGVAAIGQGAEKGIEDGEGQEAQELQG